MTHTPSQPPDKAGVVEVTQADRDAAADFLEGVGASTQEAVRGTRDGRYQVGLSTAFARHRIAALSTPPANGSPEWDWVYRHSPPPADDGSFEELHRAVRSVGEPVQSPPLNMGEGLVERVWHEPSIGLTAPIGLDISLFVYRDSDRTTAKFCMLAGDEEDVPADPRPYLQRAIAALQAELAEVDNCPVHAVPPKDQKWNYIGSHLDRDGGGNG